MGRTTAEVLETIAQKRNEKIAKLGFSFNHPLPTQRQTPLIPPHHAPHSPLMIAEVKRASPSAGLIDTIPDVCELARKYIAQGANVISVLTEEDHFKGSLSDLMAIKNTFPNISVLRKDFIQHPEEIEISYRAGADLVLLIVAMFLGDRKKEADFAAILSECKKYALTPLIEIHNEQEIQFALAFNPEILGINSRNLHDFTIDKNKALYLKSKIPASVKTIFESGIQSSFDGYLAGTFGFDGMLCGSYLVKSQDTKDNLAHLIKAYTKGKQLQNPFYQKVFDSIYTSPVPLVKICGITDLDDAFNAAEAGADMLGFILTKQSPRYCATSNVKLMSKAITRIYPHILKVGVITESKDEFILARELFKEGMIDCIQLHSYNPTTPNFYASYDLKEADFNFYACVNFDSPKDYPTHSPSPFVLLDSKSSAQGGSGKSIAISALLELKAMGKDLFIAGGVGLDNLDTLLGLKPKMLDINSKIELSVGKKDKIKLQTIIKTIKTPR
ncbi:hypothetical protein BKH46_01670 [Helicobacter sp. 12S02634-8]|uniref:phosphoribosylanthranilate isomerase n=1 Tax=Helicobacter sp. 12S02634-8 TaxID=1476199 RepID=UPI000BD15662|nr:bifunctional indole-3-glycerol phosphate synthase/phosphoribosylanthranilate isomerase [Helicobacter sp. 12S02634-8]PAF48044.1 hypothetical protein BKH46_01670 [Helicobacter sp. 12S02634-8]